MNVENNHTAETEAEATSNGSETITIQSTLGDEDEDVHKCGRCQTEFSALEAFIQHKLQQGCKRVEAREASDQDGSQEVNATNGTSPIDIQNSDSASSDKKVKSLADKNSGPLGRGHRRKITSHKVTEQTDGSDSPVSDNGVDDKHLYKVNQEGRTSFHTKGSLVRHNRRHTDERPYRCNLCGHSFRESGALTRHLKAITPCTEKIRFAQYKEILVSKDGLQKGVADDDDDDDAAAAAAAVAVTEQQEVVVVEQESEEQVVEAQTAVVSVVEADSQEVLHQVHFTMEVDGTTQEQQLVVEQSQAEALAAAAAAGDSLICQAIINSGIALGAEEAMVEETSETTEMIHEEDSECPDDEEEDEEEENIPEVQVKEEILELEIPKEAAVDGSDCPSLKLHTCPHCNRSFKGLNYFRCHVKSHLGCKPFKCTVCEKEFLTGYLLKKHMEIHVSERRYKCGECGKLYKTIGHVREHMRAHSDERPYHCARCNKGYKTKNALQVHQRTHGDEKPYVCQFCMKGFREKGSLVRHVRHHTGEKPFKCPKCGRAFAEHGTLNRHMRAKGGCHKDDSSLEEASVTEDQASVESLTTETIISDDPHAVLVEFSSVVADTQEYIIKTQTAEDVREQEVTLIQDSQNEMGNHIMKVVQRIVSQSRGSNGTGSRQIIVRNTAVDEEGASISDCGDTITIATPESLTEQVAMTLASAIGDGTLLTTSGALDASVGTVTMVTSEETVQEEIQMVQQQEEYVITTPEEVEIQTVIV
ncbi:transcription factor E4F1 isoform X4 [Takifugu rubripes]|uniref:transcription factor E4F1 isoform X4 n=1 Tax=Takifugu rubripes TaxID=31033 RepID=UPI0011453679|nr:transcription factor E4F1 isoform X4 [Takifugu rubripes]